MKNLIWSFSPWVAFLLGVRVGGVYWGAGIGLAVALVVLGRALSPSQHAHVRRHRRHLLRGSARGAGRHPPERHRHLGRYAQAVAHGSLTLIVFGSILVGKPFTEPYAREQAPEQVWRTARFHELNRRLSAVWGLAFLLGTISLIIAGSQDSRQFVLRLVVPFGALLLALMYSQKQASVTAEARPSAEPAALRSSEPRPQYDKESAVPIESRDNACGGERPPPVPNASRGRCRCRTWTDEAGSGRRCRCGRRWCCGSGPCGSSRSPSRSSWSY